jgi:hypothetical protein
MLAPPLSLAMTFDPTMLKKSPIHGLIAGYPWRARDMRELRANKGE